jgi:hypothetical protein
MNDDPNFFIYMLVLVPSIIIFILFLVEAISST